MQDFLLDWEREVATCPSGHQSKSWGPDYHQGRTAPKVRFSTRDCRPCPLETWCTRSERRLLTLRPREEHETLEAACQREDLVLLAHIRSAFAHSNGIYGSSRMTCELWDEGLPVGCHRTARLMRENGLKARQKRWFKRTTDSHHAALIAPNLLEQDFSAEHPSQKWAADISYL